jgi:hypothetical protein
VLTRFAYLLLILKNCVVLSIIWWKNEAAERNQQIICDFYAIQECCNRLGFDNVRIPRATSAVVFQEYLHHQLRQREGNHHRIVWGTECRQWESWQQQPTLAINKMLPCTIPHFLNNKRSQYLCRDITTDKSLEKISTSFGIMRARMAGFASWWACASKPWDKER